MKQAIDISDLFDLFSYHFTQFGGIEHLRFKETQLQNCGRPGDISIELHSSPKQLPR